MTDLMSKGGWTDGNLVRFRKGLPEKIGGWEKGTDASYLGTGRALLGWVALDATKYLGLGTTFKYYIKQGSDFDDVTPIRSTTSAGDVTFSATNGDATITVTDTSHGAVQNDFVTFSGASTTAGLDMNKEFEISTYVDANTYTITVNRQYSEGNYAYSSGTISTMTLTEIGG